MGASPGLDQHLRYYEHYMNWAYPGPKPAATRALAWYVYLGRPSYAPSYAEGTRDVMSARIGFSPPGGKPFDMEATLLLPVHLMVGTGYGLEPDWRHGMYQGPDLVVQGVGYDLSRPEDAARMWGMVDAVGRFTYDGQTGYGLYEYWALGDHPSFR